MRIKKTYTVRDNEGYQLNATAKNYKTLIDFLCEAQWIYDGMEITIENNKATIEDWLGKDWRKTMRNNWDMQDFNNFWCPKFEMIKSVYIK